MYVYQKCTYITAADTREEVMAAENMAAKSVPMNIHITPRIWCRFQVLEVRP